MEQDHEPEVPHSRLFVLGGLGAAHHQIKTLFAKYGEVKNVYKHFDKNTHQEKGVFYVSYTKASYAALALEELNGTVAFPSSDHKIRVMIAANRAKGSVWNNNEQDDMLKLYVKLNRKTTESELKEIFQEYGQVNYVSIPRKKAGQVSDHAIIKFFRPYHAALALENCDPSFEPRFYETKLSSGPPVSKAAPTRTPYEKSQQGFRGPESKLDQSFERSPSPVWDEELPVSTGLLLPPHVTKDEPSSRKLQKNTDSKRPRSMSSSGTRSRSPKRRNSGRDSSQQRSRGRSPVWPDVPIEQEKEWMPPEKFQYPERRQSPHWSPGRHYSHPPNDFNRERPHSPRDQRLHSPRERRMHSPRERRPHSPREQRLHSPRERRPHSPREQRLHSPREQRQHSPRERRLHSPRERRPLSPREQRQHSPREQRQHSPRERRLHSPREQRQHSPREQRLHSPREQRQHSPRERRLHSPREQMRMRRLHSPREPRQHSPGEPRLHSPRERRYSRDRQLTPEVEEQRHHFREGRAFLSPRRRHSPGSPRNGERWSSPRDRHSRERSPHDFHHEERRYSPPVPNLRHSSPHDNPLQFLDLFRPDSRERQIRQPSQERHFTRSRSRSRSRRSRSRRSWSRSPAPKVSRRHSRSPFVRSRSPSRSFSPEHFRRTPSRGRHSAERYSRSRSRSPPNHRHDRRSVSPHSLQAHDVDYRRPRSRERRSRSVDRRSTDRRSRSYERKSRSVESRSTSLERRCRSLERRSKLSERSRSRSRSFDRHHSPENMGLRRRSPFQESHTSRTSSPTSSFRRSSHGTELGPSPMDILKNYQHDGHKSIHLFTPLVVTHSAAKTIADLVPGLAHFRFDEKTSSFVAEYSIPQAAAYAKERLDGFEYLPGFPISSWYHGQKPPKSVQNRTIGVPPGGAIAPQPSSPEMPNHNAHLVGAPVMINPAQPPSPHGPGRIVVSLADKKCPVPQCRQVTFPNAQTFLRHWNEIHERRVKVRVCNHCGNVFKKYTDLRNHLLKERVPEMQIGDFLRVPEQEVDNGTFVDPGQYHLVTVPIDTRSPTVEPPPAPVQHIQHGPASVAPVQMAAHGRPPHQHHNPQGYGHSFSGIVDVMQNQVQYPQVPMHPSPVPTPAPVHAPGPHPDEERVHFCNVPLPRPKPLAMPNTICAMRLYFISSPNLVPTYMVQDAFSRFGNLINAYFIPGKTCGYARYGVTACARAAMARLNGAQLYGQYLRVEIDSDLT